MLQRSQLLLKMLQTIAFILFFLSLHLPCLALPMHDHSTTSVRSPTSSHHQHTAVLPNLSDYKISKLYSGEEVVNPIWSKLSFDMVQDHPINARKYRQRLDQDLNDFIMDPELHERETLNSKAREAAVRQVINGGMISDIQHNLIVHHKSISSSKVEDLRKGGHMAYLNTYKLSGVPKQTFIQTSRFHEHLAAQEKRQHNRIVEKHWASVMEDHGKQSDNDTWSPTQLADPHQTSTTPPPSPTRSPSPKRKKARLDPFKYSKLWQ